MKTKKLTFAFAGILALAALTSCGDPSTTSENPTSGGGGGTSTPVVETVKEVAVLVPSADHGWTGAVGTYAQSHVAELNTEYDGKYTFHVYQNDGDATQMNQVDDILATSENYAGVVILPYSNGVESAITNLANADLPFAMFDRIIENAATAASDSLVATVKGDNEGIGYETAKKFVEMGMTTADHILVMPGDNSSVPTSRNAGFKNYLTTVAGWSEAEYEAAVTSTDYTNWSRATGNSLFTSWIQSNASSLEGNWYIFTHDSEISLGVIEALAGSQITDAERTAFTTHVKALASSSGLEEMYQVIRHDHPRSTAYDAFLDGITLFDVTYDPAMIETTIDLMVEYLETGKKSVDTVVPVEVVDSSNVANKEGFGGKVS